jgi:UrcA family protein
MNIKFSPAWGALSLLFLCSPGYAQSSSAPPSRIVRYGDLDLSSPAAVRVLYKRIQHAAWRVCLESDPSASGIESMKCRRAAVDAAVDKVNKAALTALHTGKKPSDMAASSQSPLWR